MMHAIHGGLRALPANFEIFKGVGIGVGWGQSLPRDFFIFGAGMWERSHLPHPSRKKNAGMWAGMPSGMTAPLYQACSVKQSAVHGCLQGN